MNLTLKMYRVRKLHTLILQRETFLFCEKRGQTHEVQVWAHSTSDAFRSKKKI